MLSFSATYKVNNGYAQPVRGTKNLLIHLNQSQVEDYLQQRLSGAELLTCSDHLGQCEPCQKKTSTGDDAAFLALHAEVLSAELESFFSPENYGHLTHDELANYVEGKQ